ncbi:hypothetical protein ACHAPM_002746 [Fusarium culmorum]
MAGCRCCPCGCILPSFQWFCHGHHLGQYKLQDHVETATNPLFQTWANETHVGSAEECALTISSMNGLLYATGSFMPILIFPQTMAPKFERGFPSLVGFGVAACSLMLFTDFMHKRQLHLEAEQSDSAVPQSVVSLKRIRRTSTFGHKSRGSTFGTSIDAFEAFPRERPGFGRLECESYIYA